MKHPNELDQQVDNLRTLQESYNELADEVGASKRAIIHEMQLSGMDIDDNASMAEVAERMREFTLIVRGNTEFVEGSYIRSLGDAIFDGLLSKELVSIETDLPISITQSWMNQGNNTFLKRFSAPNATAMDGSYLNGCVALEHLNCPVWDGFGSTLLNKFPVLKYFCGYMGTALHSSDYLVWCKCSDSPQRRNNAQLPKLTHLFVPGFSGNSYNTFYAGNLYDFRFIGIRTSAPTLVWWLPTFNATGENMVILTDYDDPDQPHFANNGEKVLWYFKHHFLYQDDGTPTFADMSETTAPTLTLGAALRDFVMQDADVVAYFTSRNWTVA